MKEKNKMLLILGLMAFLANGDNYAAAPLIINIAKDLSISVSTAALSVTAYMLTFGVFTLLFGPLSDRFGKVKIINIAAIGTAVFSILGAFAFNLPSLLFFRAMNGAFGAGIFPVTMALVGETFDDENRHKALGKVMGLMFLGAAMSTVIGGALSFVGSWRIVYLVYGVAELIVAAVIFKSLKRDEPKVTKLNILSAYKVALSNKRLMRLVILLFFVGFSVFGSFTYSGKLLQEVTGYNILIVGLILALFGIGTVIGGRIVPKVRKKLKNSFLVFAGLLGGVSLFALSASANILVLGLSLLGFGLAFIFVQSTIVATAQDKLPTMRGTAMSLASFNMFVGGAVGTAVNGVLIKTHDISIVFLNGSFIFLGAGVIAAIFIARYEMRKKQMIIEKA